MTSIISREAILEKIATVLGEIVGEDDLSLTEATTADEVPEWDSINHVKLLISLEDELGFRFETSETSSLDNVGQLVDLVQRKLSA